MWKQAIYLGLFIFSTLGVRAEKQSEFRVLDSFVQTEFVAGESSFASSGFQLRNAYLRFQWQSSEALGANFQLGHGDLVQSPIWFSSVDHEGPWSEAYLYFQEEGWRLRAGLIPLEFGLASIRQERDSLFPVHLLQQIKYLIQKDLGLSYQMNRNGVSSHLAIHNGESTVKEPNKQNDDKLFATASIYKMWNSNSFVGVSAQAGQYLTKNSVTPKNHKLKMTSLFWGASDLRWNHDAEFVLGIEEMGNEEKRFAFGRMDFLYKLQESIALAAEVQLLDPDTKVKKDQDRDYRVGLILFSEGAKSQWHFSYGELRKESGQVDRVGWVQWNYNSVGNARLQ